MQHRCLQSLWTAPHCKGLKAPDPEKKCRPIASMSIFVYEKDTRRTVSFHVPPLKGTVGRWALESREVDQAILVQFVIKRHAANAELRGGPQAIVPMLAQRLDDPRHFGLP